MAGTAALILSTREKLERARAAAAKLAQLELRSLCDQASTGNSACAAHVLSVSRLKQGKGDSA